VQQGEGLFDDPAVLAEPGTVCGAATGDDRRDPHGLDLLAVVVVGTVGEHSVWTPSRPTTTTPYSEVPPITRRVVYLAPVGDAGMIDGLG